MKKVYRRWLLVPLLIVALLGAACGGDDDDDDDGATATTTAEVPSFAAGTTMAKIQERGKLIVGVKYDQPGFGLKNPTTGDIEGFDVEIASLVAKKIFGDDIDGKVDFVETVSAVREAKIQNGEVDFIAATYTINEARKQAVSFAGPYFFARQDIMIEEDNTTIKGVSDLNGKKVCSVQGSTSLKNLQAKAPRADVSIQFKTYSECGQALADGRVEAVTTDNTILAGLVADSNGAFKLVDNPFSDEPYGIGLKKGDEDFRAFINEVLEEITRNGDWEDAFEKTLGADSKLKLETPTPPKVDHSPGGPAGADSPTTTTAAATTTSY